MAVARPDRYEGAGGGGDTPCDRSPLLPPPSDAKRCCGTGGG